MAYLSRSRSHQSETRNLLLLPTPTTSRTNPLGRVTHKATERHFNTLTCNRNDPPATNGCCHTNDGNVHTMDRMEHVVDAMEHPGLEGRVRLE